MQSVQQGREDQSATSTSFGSMGTFFFYLSIFLSIYIHYLSINDQLIDLFYRLVKQKVFFFHLKVIIKSKKGPPCIFWPAHRSYIRTASSKPDLYIGIQRTHRLYIIWGEMQMKDICKCIGVCYNSILFIEGPMQSFQHMSSSQSSQSSFNANAMRK